MFNPGQFKQKKKRAVDPNAPPRPNLLSQDKKLRETQQTITGLQQQVLALSGELHSLKIKYNSMQSSMDQLINYMRRMK